MAASRVGAGRVGAGRVGAERRTSHPLVYIYRLDSLWLPLNKGPPHLPSVLIRLEDLLVY
jgi:hypothetical protein